MFCPKCGSEFVQGVSDCSDCRIALLDEAPAQEDSIFREQAAPADLEVVKKYSRRFEAEIGKGFLESSGIPAIVSGNEVLNIRRGRDKAKNIELLVNEEDMGEAKELFRNMGIPIDEEEYLGEDYMDAPVIKEKGKEAFTRMVLTGLLLGFLLLVALNFIMG